MQAKCWSHAAPTVAQRLQRWATIGTALDCCLCLLGDCNRGQALNRAQFFQKKPGFSQEELTLQTRDVSPMLG